MLPTSLIIFRSDSSSTLGSGHIQRCLTLANYLRARGTESIFISKKLEGHFGYLVEKEKYPIHFISSDLNEIEDGQSSLQIINSLKNSNNLIQAIVIDHYFLSQKFEQNFKQSQMKVVVIDDLMNRLHNCDILIDQNYKTDYRNCYSDLVPTHCKKFLGPSYALLRPQFYDRQKYASDKKTALKNIFVFFGGSDPTGETLKFLLAVQTNDHFNYHVLLSKGNLHLNSILKIQKNNFHFHIEPENIAQLMEQCDLYVGSGGTITWERMCMKLSGVLISIADNQVPGATALAQDKLHFYLGTKEEADYSIIPQLIANLEKNSLEEINRQLLIYITLFSPKHIEDLLNAICA